MFFFKADATLRRFFGGFSISANLGVPTPTYELGPQLPAERHKPPFKPGTVGIITFFFGPIAGAFVSSINLRRMGKSEKASKVVRYTLLASVAIAIILLLTPDPFSRFIGIGLEFGAAAFFPKVQDEEYKEWQTANYGVEPSSGWRSVGWAFLGSLLFFLVAIIVGVILSLLKIPIP